MMETRSRKQYRCEMTDKEHEELLETLTQHKGPVVISGYETDLYNSVLSGWNKFERTSYSQARSKKKEVIWLNYDIPWEQMNLSDFL